MFFCYCHKCGRFIWPGKAARGIMLDGVRRFEHEKCPSKISIGIYYGGIFALVVTAILYISLG